MYFTADELKRAVPYGDPAHPDYQREPGYNPHEDDAWKELAGPDEDDDDEQDDHSDDLN